ncbi:hypothetical protein Hypma_007929 [Hypsizygus marmoreus]|uniref:Uncharacterized protein n=1 Tax=Hypsizygus marmoreus TaxID=39966 RepID=A0A369JXG1_HYPMA|nr:hypothetical protein Hypma_007929 [Hypsizygus marmoreus]
MSARHECMEKTRFQRGHIDAGNCEVIQHVLAKCFRANSCEGFTYDTTGTNTRTFLTNTSLFCRHEWAGIPQGKGALNKTSMMSSVTAEPVSDRTIRPPRDGLNLDKCNSGQ